MSMQYVKSLAAHVPMTLSWCFEDYCLQVSLPLCVLFVICMLATTAWGHPDLLAQIEHLSVQLQQQPEDAELLIKRGDLYRRHEDYAAAARDFAAARHSRPDHPLLDFYQGRLQLEMGDPAGAEKLLQRYLSADPQHAAAWVLLGQARLGLHRPEAAAEDFAKAIDHSAKPSPSLYRLQILALLTAGEQHREAARAVVDAGLDRFPQEVSLLGLGTDIALATDAPNIAAAYIGTLPQAIVRLDRWQLRLELSRCLGEKTPDAEVARSACLETAGKALNEQLAALAR